MQTRRLIIGGFLLSASIIAQAAVIDFDGTGAPNLFVDTTPLTNAYASEGVSFSVGNWSILNQGGGFGFNALSGTDFLAYNVIAGINFNEETVSFAKPVKNISIWAASSFAGTFVMQAFDGSNVLLGEVTSDSTSTWTNLSLNINGISSLKLIANGGFGAFDNFSYSPAVSAIPEPETYAMLLAGLGLVGFAARRKQS